MPVPVTVREIFKLRDRGQATTNRTARKGGTVSTGRPLFATNALDLSRPRCHDDM